MEKYLLNKKSKSEKVPVIKKSENEEAIPSYRQLNEWLAAMTANEHVEDRDEKKDQLSCSPTEQFGSSALLLLPWNSLVHQPTVPLSHNLGHQPYCFSSVRDG